jgi:hypothetical protein
VDPLPEPLLLRRSVLFISMKDNPLFKMSVIELKLLLQIFNIHRPICYLKTHRFGYWILSPSSGGSFLLFTFASYRTEKATVRIAECPAEIRTRYLSNPHQTGLTCVGSLRELTCFWFGVYAAFSPRHIFSTGVTNKFEKIWRFFASVSILTSQH